MKKEDEFIFDKAVIQKNCDDFYSLYNATRGEVYEMCNLKKKHTYEVAKNCMMIAGRMGLCEYDCDMAWVIGQLHDFARFGQAVKTHSLDDSAAFDHAKLGARILFTHHLVDDIIPGYNRIDEADKIAMEKAVYHHSEYELPDNLTGRERIFCEIIREADKLDIFRVIAESDYEVIYGCSLWEIERDDISPAIEEAFYEHRLAEYAKRVTRADYHMAHIALCFGLKEKAARHRAIEQGYIEQMMDIEFLNPKVQKKYLGMKEQLMIYLNGYDIICAP